MSRPRSSRYANQQLNPKDYTIADFFNDEEIGRLMLQARKRGFAAFRHATEVRGGKRRGTDNFIRGVQPKMSALAHYVVTWSRDPLISSKQLADLIDVHNVRQRDLEALLSQLRMELVMQVLDVMCVTPPKTPVGFQSDKCTDEIWYDSVRCYWQIRQSSIDEATWLRNNRKRMKIDQRHYHGRNRSQSKRRGIPAGVSVSFS